MLNRFCNSRIQGANRIERGPAPAPILVVSSEQSDRDGACGVDAETLLDLGNDIRGANHPESRLSGSGAICKPLGDLGELGTAEPLLSASSLKQRFQAVTCPRPQPVLDGLGAHFDGCGDGLDRSTVA
jgi:hypothetical protein